MCQHQIDGFLPSAARTHTMVRLQIFTGTVEEIGTVRALEERDDIAMWDGSKGKGTMLAVEGSVVVEGAYPG